MFVSLRSVKQLGLRFGWKHGEWIAIVEIPDGAPITYEGPDRYGHVMLYDPSGGMLREDGAEYLLQHCVVRVVHGPSADVEAF